MAIAVAAAFTFSACSDSDLDSTNYTQATSSNYPVNEQDLNKQVAALYGVMNQYCNDPLQTPWMVNNIMSDDANGAGGTGDVECHAIGHLMSNKDALFETAWKSTYVGIARANSIIASVSKLGMKGQAADQLLGEAYFMRGLFYLWGTQFWGDIPAYWTAAAPDPCPRQDAETVIYPHILADFLSAYNLMSYGATQQGDGHATKGAAAGYLARAYMFYQGFYKHEKELHTAKIGPVVLPEQPGATETLGKDEVVKYLEDAIKNGGYDLVKDFRCLWQYTNQYTIKEYPFVQDLDSIGAVWAGNGNSESMFQVQFGNMASWNGTVAMGFTNMTSLYCGLRCDETNGYENGNEKSVPFGRGWGQGTINANLWDEWPDSDPRKRATILDAPTELGDGFVFSKSCTEDAGYYNKKWMPITTSKSTFGDATDAYTWWGIYRKENTDGVPNNNGNSFQGDHFADIVLLRLADVYLMHSELTGTTTYMNEVRKRAGLNAKTSYSLQDLKEERRWELAGEGIRFNDLRRWSGKNGGETCEAAVALQKQEGSRVNYTENWTKMKHAASSWAKRYAQTDGFLQIPPEQIRIVDNEEVLKQNKGWDASSSDWNMTGTPVY